MTTVAWDGKQLAADSRVTFSNLTGFCIKVAKLFDGRLLASSGCAEDHHQVREWLETGGLRCARVAEPKQPMLDKDYTAILIDQEGAWIIQANLTKWPIPRSKWAIGSGRDFAMAAMHLGKSAFEAVGIACEYDCYSALPVVAIDKIENC